MMEDPHSEHTHLDIDEMDNLADTLRDACLDVLKSPSYETLCFQQLVEILFTASFEILGSQIHTEHELLHFTSDVYEVVSHCIARTRDRVDAEDDDENDEEFFDVGNN